MPDSAPPTQPFDVFLSHHSADKPWVRRLRDALREKGLNPWFDERELPEQDNFVDALSADGLRRSRFLVLVITPRSLQRPWVKWEWTNFMALNGPLGRVIPVLLEEAPLPPALAATQALSAAGRSLGELAELIARRVGRLSELPENDLRRLALGQVLAFDLARKDDGWRVVGPDGDERTTASPQTDATFADALTAFRRLVRTPLVTDADRADLTRVATAVGRALFDVLFAGGDGERLARARAAAARPVLALRGDDDLLGLPWELLHDGSEFPVREGKLDLLRSTRAEVDEGCLLTAPAGPFTLVVNVSAPQGSALHYETESYRLTRALTEHCPMTPTELGTLDDLVATVRQHQPTGVHFSGHGGPGVLQFEDDDGAPATVVVKDLAARLRRELPGRPPPFFYLACCHGNDVGEGAESAAALLHREGVDQVVGYSGPIVDELSTRAEEALYAALAAGQTTREAVRLARAALLRPLAEAEGRHRDEASTAGDGTYPLAWSQLVLYHRGPDYPLGTPTTAAQLRQAEQALRRTFEGLGKRRVLRTGFIGRRRELHRVRRHLLREGKRVLVLQGLGGLGKSTLAFHIPPLLKATKDGVCILWCEGADKDANPVEALVAQLLDYCRKRFGVAWEGVVQQVDRAAGDDSVQRFAMFLQVLLENVPRLVLVLDNLESLLIGPTDATAERPDEQALGSWRSEGLRNLWLLLRELAEGGDKLWVIASCRYQNDDFHDVLLPVTPLPPDALFRLTAWFEGLPKLASATRGRLVARLDGHPRAVEYAEDLVKHRLLQRERTHGAWRLPQPPSAADLEREWQQLVAPVLPEVREKLWANLLLAAIWDHVLDDRQRRMLYRMTLLRMPWEWGLMAHLGDASEDAATAERVADELRRTSLLETVELADSPHFTLHPETAAYVRLRYPDDEGLRLKTHQRVGSYLEELAKTSRWIETDLEAGHHLFEAGAYDRSYKLLGPASDWLQAHGRVREGLQVLEPFLAEAVWQQMQRQLVGRMFGTVGLAHHQLSHPQRAIDFYEQTLVISREIGDRRSEGAALGSLGNAYAALGQPQRAIDFYQQRLVISRGVGDRRGEGNALGSLGNAYADLGQPQRAIDCNQQHLAIAREIGDRRGEGNALGSLGCAYYNLGQPQRAIDFLEQALVISRGVGDRRGEGDNMGNLGLAYAALSQPQRAIDCYQQHLAIAREIGDRRGEGNALGRLGNAYADLGQPQRAIDFYQQHLAVAREIVDRRGEAIACWNLGDELVKLDRLAEAIPLMEIRVRFEQEIGHLDAEKDAAVVAKLRERLAGQPPQASP
jgi:tetratricopeptide (TPR) repeat protein